MATSPADPIPVHTGPWTEADLLVLSDDGQRHELVEGSLVVSPPPAGRHQGVASRLLRRLADQAPPTLEVVETLGVRIFGWKRPGSRPPGCHQRRSLEQRVAHP